MKRIEIESHSQIIDIIKMEVRCGNGNLGLIGLRHFPTSKIEQVIATGSDRDENSPIHFDDGDLFPTPLLARAAGVTSGSYFVSPKRLTYMRIVDTSGEEPVSIPHRRKIIPAFDNMNYLGKLSSYMAQVLYDPCKLERKSENEFWFRGDPRDAVIAVVTIEPR